MSKKTVLTLQEMKEQGQKITMVTAYDYSGAMLSQKAGRYHTGWGFAPDGNAG